MAAWLGHIALYGVAFKTNRVGLWDSSGLTVAKSAAPFVLSRPLHVDSFIPERVPSGRSFPSTVVDGVPSDATIALLGAR